MIVSLLVGLVSAIIGGAMAGLVSAKFGRILGYFIWGAALLCGGLMGFSMRVRNAKMPKNILIGASVIFALVAMASMYYVLYVSPITLKSGITISPNDVVSYPDFLSMALSPIDIPFVALAIYVIYKTPQSIVPKVGGA